MDFMKFRNQMLLLGLIAAAIVAIALQTAVCETKSFVYDSHQKKDPFVPLFGVKSQGASSREIISIDDVEFQGVATNAAGERIVIINGEMLKKGSVLDSLTVIEILKNKAVISIRDREHILSLYEKGGSESE